MKVNKEVCILVVDDNRSIVRTLELVLQHQGYNVLIAYDGYEALEKATQGKPDIILLDVITPGIDGYEVCRRLHEQLQTRDIPVVYLTVKGRVDLPDLPQLKKIMERNFSARAEGIDTGAIGYISKPVAAGEVLKEVRRVLALGELGGGT